MYKQKQKGYTERIAISKENKDRMRGEAREIIIRFYPREKHRNLTDNIVIGYMLEFWCDEKTM